MNLISEKTGISFELENGNYDENAEELYQELLAQDYLLLRTSKAMAYSNANNIIVSSPLMDIEMSYVELQEKFVKNPLQIDTIALTQDLAYIEPILLEQNAAYKRVYYENVIACLEAVLNGKASIAFVSAFRASYLMQKPEYADKLMQFSGEN